MKTIVIFRKFKDKGDIIALFPYEKHNDQLCMSYQRVGQHGGSDYIHCMKGTVQATQEEYQALHDELTKLVGYDLKVMKRFSRKASNEQRT